VNPEMPDNVTHSCFLAFTFLPKEMKTGTIVALWLGKSATSNGITDRSLLRSLRKDVLLSKCFSCFFDHSDKFHEFPPLRQIEKYSLSARLSFSVVEVEFSNVDAHLTPVLADDGSPLILVFPIDWKDKLAFLFSFGPEITEALG
jgi:hypothetical protein